jgi:hypothetical protein
MATASALVVEGGTRELTGGRLPEEILAEVERPASPWLRREVGHPRASAASRHAHRAARSSARRPAAA